MVFEYPDYGRQFNIQIIERKLHKTHKEETKDLNKKEDNYIDQENVGVIVVIENVFHYKQILPLRMGDNQIGRYQKGNPINTPIETVDPSVDLWHCTINVSRDKRGQLKYTLQDGNSNTGTFVDNIEITPRERRIIENNTLFTIGATSILLKTKDGEEE